MSNSKKPGTFEPGNKAAAKSGIEKKMRIRVMSQADIEAIEKWLPGPEARGKALMDYVEKAISESLIATKEQEESNE